MFNPDTAPYARSNYLPSLEAGTRSLKIEPIVAPVRSDAEIEATVTWPGREPAGGLVVMPDGLVYSHRAAVISLVARHSIPAVYHHYSFARDGGLLTKPSPRT
jgi:hypothetical protein